MQLRVQSRSEATLAVTSSPPSPFAPASADFVHRQYAFYEIGRYFPEQRRSLHVIVHVRMRRLFVHSSMAIHEFSLRQTRIDSRTSYRIRLSHAGKGNDRTPRFEINRSRVSVSCMIARSSTRTCRRFRAFNTCKETIRETPLARFHPSARSRPRNFKLIPVIRPSIIPYPPAFRIDRTKKTGACAQDSQIDTPSQRRNCIRAARARLSSPLTRALVGIRQAGRSSITVPHGALER